MEVSSGRAIGPRAWSFCVEIPISAPMPNCSPSVNAVDALTLTVEASTRSTKVSHASQSFAEMASVWPEPCSLMWSAAATTPSTTLAAMSKDRYSSFQSSSVAGMTSPDQPRLSASPWTLTSAATRASSTLSMFSWPRALSISTVSVALHTEQRRVLPLMSRAMASSTSAEPSM